MSDLQVEILSSFLNTFTPGLSPVLDFVFTVLEVDVPSYRLNFLPLATVAVALLFILPWIFRRLHPIVLLLMCSAQIKYRNDFYPQVINWMSSVRFFSLSGSVVVGTSDSFGFIWAKPPQPRLLEMDDPEYQERIYETRSTPGPSRLNFFLYKGSWFFLMRDPCQNATDIFSRNSEDIFFYYFPWNKAKFKELLISIQKFDVDSRDGKIPVFIGHQNKETVTWQNAGNENPRSLGSIALSEETKEDLFHDITKFFSQETASFYQDLGIPLRRGYLLDGEPGVGKTTLTRAIATEFCLPMYIINPATLDDYAVQELFRKLPTRCLVSIEDIDAAGIESRGTTTKKTGTLPGGISLASLLNAMDGIGAHSGHLIVATTNMKAKLDAALLRPGRLDKHVRIPFPDEQTIYRYFCRVFGKSVDQNELHKHATEFSKTVTPFQLSMATLQEHFIQCGKSPSLAVANAGTLENVKSKSLEN